MSETLSQDPENLGTGYNLAQTYSPTPATPNSTVQDAPNSNLPPFSTFSAEMDATSGYSSDRLFGDTRLLDISSWDYYGEARLLERTENGLTAISSQPQYRPWESKPVDSTSQESLRQSFTSTTPITTFADAFAQSNMPKLPSFQSQFQSFNETSPVTTSEATTLTTLTNLTPVSPNSASPGSHSLTTLNTNFHTLSAVNTRNYPLVPAPIQAREIPSIQQQFLDERHIQLYTHPTTSLTTLGNTIHSASIFPAQNGTIIQNSQLITPPTVVTVLKSEPASMADLKLGHNLANLQDTGLKIQNVSLHPTQFQNPMSTVLDNNVLYNGLDKKLNGMNNVIDSPTRNDFRKKERRKIRANSMESSAESDGASSNMEMGSENSGQVASVSSTAGYKGHPLSGGGGLEHDDISGGNPDKQVKKKRKRCGECIGCQRKDNCGDCAPCRNDKSHQICKQRRCEKLTEKKLYGEDGFVRGESRRGRGKGRSAGSYRGRKPSGPVSLPPNNAQEVNPPPPPSRPSPQPVHMLKPEQAPQPQPMTPVPFYADPNRFTTPVWQADPAQVVSGWPQGQFIQQISAAPQAPLEGYTQQYSNGIYQTTYQQPGFEANTFYTTGPVQVVTNAARPPSVPEQSQLTPRPNSTYSHTPSPVPSQTQQTNQRNQYQQEYVSTNQNYVTPATTPGGTVESSQQSGGMSRPSSVNSTVAAPVGGQTFQQNNAGFIPISSSSFSPGSNQNPNFVNSAMSTNSGNEMPGYPPVNSHPQLVSHNYNGGYPGNECGNENIAIQNNQNEEQQQHHHHHPHHHHWTSNNHQWKPNCESAKSSESDMQNYGNNSPLNHRQSTNEQQGVESPQKRELENQYSQIDRIDLNTRIKTMILNKQQQLDSKDEAQNDNQNKTGHFLSYSHHRHRNDNIGGGGGVSDDSSSSSRKNSTTIQHQSLSKQLDYLNYPNQSNFHYDHPPSPTIHECLQHKVNFQPQLTTITSDNDASPGICKDESNINEKRYTKRILTKNNVTPTLSTPYKSNLSNSEISNDDKSFKSETKFSEFSLSSETESNYSTPEKSTEYSPRKFADIYNSPDVLKTGQAEVIPECGCFPSNMGPPEPGSFYTHLGSSHSLSGLRKCLEERTGLIGSSIRIEKVCYSGKEGKTPQGCPIAKWIIRRSGLEEKYLVIVKHRQGHFCSSAYIVVCIVVWEGLDNKDADDMYSMLCTKLNKFGTPTARRCGTNDTRTCACQGLDPDSCGASFSFGCSWSMYYNGCKYARSKLVRKFKLTEQTEEKELEEKFQALANHISPMYKNLAPKSFENQCQYEETASECRLGLNPGRPFSGVTACLDFCAHAHKDSHNMNNGCTVVVSLTKHRDLNKSEDEQLHVLPLYTIDKTDEFGAEDKQREKMNNGSIEVLNKYQCEVRVRNEPQQPCRRRKRKDDGNEKGKAETPKKNSVTAKDQNVSSQSSYYNTHHQQAFFNNKHELQSDQVTSTVFDASNKKHGKNSTKLNHNRKGPQFSWNSSPVPKTHSDNDVYKSDNFVSSSTPFSLLRKDQFNNTAYNLTYPNSSQHSSIPPPNGLDSYNFNAQSYQMAENFSNINPNQNKNTSNIFSHTPTGGQSYHCNNISYNPVPNNYPNHENSPFIQNGHFHQNGYFGFSKLNYINNTPNNPMLWGSNEYNGYHHNGFNKLTNDYFPYSTPHGQELPYGSRYISSSPDSYVLRNPFEDFPNFGYNFQPPFSSSPLKPPDSPNTTVQPKLLGTVSEVIDNAESFLDSQVGGVAIALTHGSILFECAKHELHATTALKKPNRQNPTRISLVFYQHRNMNRAKHGWDEYEEKLKLRKMDSANLVPDVKEKENAPDVACKDSEAKRAGDVFPRVYTLPTVSVTTLFPMYPCTMTGPYVNGSTNG